MNGALQLGTVLLAVRASLCRVSRPSEFEEAGVTVPIPSTVIQLHPDILAGGFCPTRNRACYHNYFGKKEV